MVTTNKFIAALRDDLRNKINQVNAEIKKGTIAVPSPPQSAEDSDEDEAPAEEHELEDEESSAESNAQITKEGPEDEDKDDIVSEAVSNRKTPIISSHSKKIKKKTPTKQLVNLQSKFPEKYLELYLLKKTIEGHKSNIKLLHL